MGCVTGLSGGHSSVFSSSDVFRLALDFLPDVLPSSKFSFAASTAPVKGSSSMALVLPLLPAFCFLRDAGVLALSLPADSEVDDVAGVDGGVPDN